MERIKWIERKFSFDLPEGWLLNILERLRGTGVRIIELTSSLSNEETQHKSDGKWSIKEHIGHLSDLEELHEARIDDFIAQNKSLRAADMSNEKTNNANHNEKEIDQLIQSFIKNRNQFISRLEIMDDNPQKFKSIHPRLGVMMKPVDFAFFIAEHDDHHLASIREIKNKVSGIKSQGN